MVLVQSDKWTPLIEQIEQVETLPEKFNLLATMVRMLAENDLSCMENRIDELNHKFDLYMKKIYAVGIVIAVLTFTGIDIQSVVDLIVKVVK